jgi:cobalamin biosynthesis protein CobD/CbiB
MSNNTKTRRRRFGVICIVLAIVMLIAGETVLKAKLTGVALLGYWLVCLMLTVLAALAAIGDAARVGQELKAEQRSLLEETLRKIEREKQSRDGSKQ